MYEIRQLYSWTDVSVQQLVTSVSWHVETQLHNLIDLHQTTVPIVTSFSVKTISHQFIKQRIKLKTNAQIDEMLYQVSTDGTLDEFLCGLSNFKTKP
jgi:hypothetical protein